MDSSLLNGYKPNTIFIGYSPNDFFYSTATELGTMLSDISCNELKPYDETWNTKCKEDKFPNNSESCINVELCKNRDYSKKLLSINRGNASSDEKYYDIKEEYNKLFMDSINLGIGCVFLFWFIFKNR
jgi:hypothetical protein